MDRSKTKNAVDGIVIIRQIIVVLWSWVWSSGPLVTIFPFVSLRFSSLKESAAISYYIDPRRVMLLLPTVTMVR